MMNDVMIKSPDPSISLRMLREWMEDNDKTSVKYYHSQDWSSYPIVDGESTEEVVWLCSDVCESDEYDSPTNVSGFVYDGLTLTWM